MEPEDELNDLRLQFQTLQRLQEKRKLDKKNKKEADQPKISVIQDDLDLHKQGIQTDKWVFFSPWCHLKFIQYKTYIAHFRICHCEYLWPEEINVNNQLSNL